MTININYFSYGYFVFIITTTELLLARLIGVNHRGKSEDCTQSDECWEGKRIFSKRSQFDRSELAFRKRCHRRYARQAESSRVEKCGLATQRSFSKCSLESAATIGLSDD
jgi:hypothetical protein